MHNNESSFFVFENCKYYSKQLEVIRKYVTCLYDVFEIHTGGIGHVVLDEDNFRDEDIEWLVNECNKPENSSREEIEIVKLIANGLSKTTIQERAALFSSFYEDVLNLKCDKNCEVCNITKGKMLE